MKLITISPILSTFRTFQTNIILCSVFLLFLHITNTSNHCRTFIRVFLMMAWREVVLKLCKVKRNGDSTVPCGVPVLQISAQSHMLEKPPVLVAAELNQEIRGLFLPDVLADQSPWSHLDLTTKRNDLKVLSETIHHPLLHTVLSQYASTYPTIMYLCIQCLSVPLLSCIFCVTQENKEKHF